MTLFAKVRKVTGLTPEFDDDELAGPPTRAEIFADDGGYFLLRYTADEKFAGDTWHADLDEAKKQALAELSILPEDWSSSTS